MLKSITLFSKHSGLGFLERMCIVQGYLRQEVFNFLNLTTGLEWIPILDLDLFHGFVRLQSSHLENKQFERFLQEFDNNVLMLLALGKTVFIWDCTSRKLKGEDSRACWQGISWINYVLDRAWFNHEGIYAFGMHICFREKYAHLSRPTLKRLKYYRRFLQTNEIHLGYECKVSDHDGDNDYYGRLVHAFIQSHNNVL